MSVRDEIVLVARWGIHHETQIHYGRRRPMPLTAMLPITTDCSGFVTLCYYLAGAPDPNGHGYDGNGYTGTLLHHMTEIAPGDVQRGDVVVWGVDPGHHAAVVLEPGEDPLLCSHGQERGPLAIRFSVESRSQPPVAAWLSCLS